MNDIFKKISIVPMMVMSLYGCVDTTSDLNGSTVFEGNMTSNGSTVSEGNTTSNGSMVSEGNTILDDATPRSLMDSGNAYRIDLDLYLDTWSSENQQIGSYGIVINENFSESGEGVFKSYLYDYEQSEWFGPFSYSKKQYFLSDNGWQRVLWNFDSDGNLWVSDKTKASLGNVYDLNAKGIYETLTEAFDGLYLLYMDPELEGDPFTGRAFSSEAKAYRYKFEVLNDYVAFSKYYTDEKNDEEETNLAECKRWGENGCLNYYTSIDEIQNEFISFVSFDTANNRDYYSVDISTISLNEASGTLEGFRYDYDENTYSDEAVTLQWQVKQVPNAGRLLLISAPQEKVCGGYAEFDNKVYYIDTCKLAGYQNEGDVKGGVMFNRAAATDVMDAFEPSAVTVRQQ